MALIIIKSRKLIHFMQKSEMMCPCCDFILIADSKILVIQDSWSLHKFSLGKPWKYRHNGMLRIYLFGSFMIILGAVQAPHERVYFLKWIHVTRFTDCHAWGRYNSSLSSGAQIPMCAKHQNSSISWLYGFNRFNNLNNWQCHILPLFNFTISNPQP